MQNFESKLFPGHSTETPESQLGQLKGIMLEYAAMERELKHFLGAVDHVKEQVRWWERELRERKFDTV